MGMRTVKISDAEGASPALKKRDSSELSSPNSPENKESKRSRGKENKGLSSNSK